MREWCSAELVSAKLGDDRLNNRLLKVADDLLKNPTASIVEASNTWKEAKAAYRLFDNDKFLESHILQLHQDKTVERLMQSEEETFFAIQDTTTLNYTHHPKKKGLGKINKSAGFSAPVKGCFLHNSLLITESGLPLGLLNQTIYKHNENKISNKLRPITEKESYRWLESLKKIQSLSNGKEIITLCDRESDIYEFFMQAQELNAKVLVRASSDRIAFGTKHTDHETLWSYMKKQNLASSIVIHVPKQRGRSARDVTLEVRFAEIIFNPPQRSPSAQIDKLSKITLNAIWLNENSDLDDRLEWMLLTNVKVDNAEEAVKVGQWYKMRWQVECYHRILKSGCEVENCRLETFDRLKRYLTLKSIIAYRLFYLTMLSRIDPKTSCEIVFAKHEWKVLYCRVKKTTKIPKKPPTTYEAIRMLAQLGGFLNRKNDGDPGMTPIWRGWNKLTELSELWLIMSDDTYG